MELRRITMNPYDFTLYQDASGGFVIKVVFSEGDYKMDIERYFVVGSLSDDSMEALKLLAVQIRDDYPDTPYPEIHRADVTIVR
ncbi:MAG: hypothetical protein PGN37_22325 [Mycobacterium kyogaense]|uniref:hypothetical protein n=1 Tax=Mycobacterium kyogaense TaxID=2212479 RepID=UPI002FF4EFAD